MSHMDSLDKYKLFKGCFHIRRDCFVSSTGPVPPHSPLPSWPGFTLVSVCMSMPVCVHSAVQQVCVCTQLTYKLPMNNKEKVEEGRRTLAQVCSLQDLCRTQPRSPLHYNAGLFFILRLQQPPSTDTWIIWETPFVHTQQRNWFWSHGCLGSYLSRLFENFFRLLW